MINSLHVGNFLKNFAVCWFFSKLTFSKKSFRNTIRVSNSLDPVQAWQNVRPGLGKNSLQRLSADDNQPSDHKVYDDIQTTENEQNMKPVQKHS